MPYMQRAHVTHIEEARRRSSRVARAIDAHRRIRAAAERPSRSPGGRAWINGVETGEPALALAHLSESYD